ncbi:integrase catalytic domain-containing protein [Trichonephila clavipes]|uniref:Integrase catalytic domain-containing protein n=1 Tax=Trichonephila clavipes TaxID=2585209 RepID=A0A8X6VV66_TRICX|nr:integrase catalytic domain-containing protein [Trichonephila clavipes]
MNPADIACRGLSPKELPTCVLWWEGPQWLSCEMDSWPKQPKRNDQTSSVSKERKRTAFSFPVAVNCDFIDYLFLKFSSFTKIIDIFAFCFRYITNCKARVGKMKNLDSKGYRATTSKQLMGDLPTHRVTPSRPFSVCGVDYAGPINILRYRGRGARTTKGYIALFVCFVTKALHLELVSDLTSEAFIASLKRFCARRGAPKHIYCDNGTTFVGARRKLLEIFKFVSKLNENEQFCYFLSQVNIEWHFSPPVSPHFGGLWEAGVKSIKYHLKRVIGNINLTFEEFSTLLTQVEAILNSRPLVSLDCDNDPDSLNILTPSHFLIGEVITSSPEHTNDDKLSLRSRWDIVQKMKLGFWRKWKMDYLSNLQNRTKWKSPNHNIKVGEIVIIKEDNIPPATWPLGKVIETHPGRIYSPVDRTECPTNERWDYCSAHCQKNCSQFNDDIPCTGKCTSGCVCKDGYVRGPEGKCILPYECKNKSESNQELISVTIDCNDKAYYDLCPTTCPRNCDNFRTTKKKCFPFICLPACVCKDEYVRGPNGKCIKSHDCPKENGEEYSPSESHCEGNCFNKGNDIKCISNSFTWVSGCKCKKGLVRGPDGNCIYTNECPSHPKPENPGAGVTMQLFRSSGQSDAKTPVLSSQASLVLIYRPTEEMKDCVYLVQLGV